MEHIRLETIRLKNHPVLNEAWVQKVIADDPGILGLGDLILRDKERIQPKAGRLDLLLQDPDIDKRYEVEVQLGATDESHIVRTIEYWDIERKRYPQYDHCAVIVAEDITGRFNNIIGLFNGAIPLIALKMTAIKIGDNVGLNFIKVIDEQVLGLVDEDESIASVADRDYWLNRATQKTVEMVDKLLEIIHEFAPDYYLKYNNYYIGLAKDGIVNNFMYCKPKKQFVGAEFRLQETPELTTELEEAELEMEYLAKYGTYRLRLRQGEINKNKELINKILTLAFEQSQS